MNFCVCLFEYCALSSQFFLNLLFRYVVDTVTRDDVQSDGSAPAAKQNEWVRAKTPSPSEIIIFFFGCVMTRHSRGSRRAEGWNSSDF